MPTVTLTPTTADGVLNGTIEVTLVPAPSSGIHRLVRWLSIHNADDMVVNLSVFVANGAGRRLVFHADLDPGDTFHLDSNDVVPLDDVRSMTAKLANAPHSAEPDWVSGWADQAMA